MYVSPHAEAEQEIHPGFVGLILESLAISRTATYNLSLKILSDFEDFTILAKIGVDIKMICLASGSVNFNCSKHSYLHETVRVRTNLRSRKSFLKVRYRLNLV